MAVTKGKKKKPTKKKPIRKKITASSRVFGKKPAPATKKTFKAQKVNALKKATKKSDSSLSAAKKKAADAKWNLDYRKSRHKEHTKKHGAENTNRIGPWTSHARRALKTANATVGRRNKTKDSLKKATTRAKTRKY